MNSKINELAPKSSFELIRDAIAAILSVEFARQYLLTYDQDPDLNLKVWLERVVTFSTTEMPAINVKYVTTNFENKNPLTIDGYNIYHVDVLTDGKDKGSEFGDKLANIKLQKILRTALYILNNPKYKTLGFAPGFISNIMPKQIKVTDGDTKDGQYSSFGRLEIQVRAIESTTGVGGVLASSSYVTMKINETSDGYYYGVN